jgi:hypothetical protein
VKKSYSKERENKKIYNSYRNGQKFFRKIIFPQQHRSDFLKQKILISDPRYLTWLEKNIHKNLYNNQWNEFLKSNPSKQKILKKGQELANDYEFHINY